MRQQLERATAESYIRMKTNPLYRLLSQISKADREEALIRDQDLLPNFWSPLERHEHRCIAALGKEATESNPILSAKTRRALTSFIVLDPAANVSTYLLLYTSSPRDRCWEDFHKPPNVSEGKLSKML